MGYVFDALNRAGDGAPERDGDPLPLNKASLPEAALEAVAQNRVAAAAPPEPTPQTDNPAPATGEDEPDHEPVIARIGKVDDRLVSLVEPGSLMAEEYRSIRTSLLARCEQRRHLVHTITSATPQEGKTITSLNLGLSFAELRNRSVCVVEADLRLPTFAKLLNLEPCEGLVQCLRGDASVSSVIRRVGGSRLNIIVAGARCNAEAIQLLSGPRFAEVLDGLKRRFDHVIVDTPPVTELADAGIVGGLSDEVLMVVRMQRTPRPLVEQAIRTLKGYNAAVAGLIATDQRRSRHRYYHYRYGYRYRYGYGYHEQRAA